MSVLLSALLDVMLDELLDVLLDVLLCDELLTVVDVLKSGSVLVEFEFSRALLRPTRLSAGLSRAAFFSGVMLSAFSNLFGLVRVPFSLSPPADLLLAALLSLANDLSRSCNRSSFLS